MPLGRPQRLLEPLGIALHEDYNDTRDIAEHIC